MAAAQPVSLEKNATVRSDKEAQSNADHEKLEEVHQKVRGVNPKCTSHALHQQTNQPSWKRGVVPR